MCSNLEIALLAPRDLTKSLKSIQSNLKMTKIWTVYPAYGKFRQNIEQKCLLDSYICLFFDDLAVALVTFFLTYIILQKPMSFNGLIQNDDEAKKSNSVQFAKNNKTEHAVQSYAAGKGIMSLLKYELLIKGKQQR